MNGFAPTKRNLFRLFALITLISLWTAAGSLAGPVVDAMDAPGAVAKARAEGKSQPSQPAGTAAIADRLEDILTNTKQPKVKMGARVVDLSTGRVIFDHGGTVPMVPASNMKLIVMCAALDAFGRDYQYKTMLAQRGSDIVVIGGGDPTIGDERIAKEHGKPITEIFANWAAKLKAAGVREIRGNLIIDDSLFDTQFVHPHWPPPQFQTWYEAPIGALNFSSNCLDIRVLPTKAGKPAEISVVPPNTLIDLANKTVTGGKQTISANRQRGGDTIVVTGSVSHETKLGPISVRDPGLYFGYVFKTVLASQGIKVNGKVIRQTVRLDGERLPADCKIIDTYRSPIVWTLARAGKQSLGMMAESLIKLLGAKSSGVGTWDSGRAAVKGFLQKAHAPMDQVTIDDGSGLSRNNRLSPAVSTAVLEHMFHASGGQFEALLDVLSHAGIDGTLEKRMKTPETKGRVFAKTGYIDGVRTLAGYVQTRSGKWLAFAIFYNQAASTKPLSNLQDQACKIMAEWNGD